MTIRVATTLNLKYVVSWCEVWNCAYEIRIITKPNVSEFHENYSTRRGKVELNIRGLIIPICFHLCNILVSFFKMLDWLQVSASIGKRLFARQQNQGLNLFN